MRQRIGTVQGRILHLRSQHQRKNQKERKKKTEHLIYQMFRFLFSFFLIFPLMLAAQVQDTSLNRTDTLPHAFSSDRSGSVIVNSIVITGNRVTKQHIILREITFEKGD